MRDWAQDPRYADAVMELAASAGCRRLDDLGVRACRELAAAGVPCLVMRGPAVAQRLYDEAGDRLYMDVDVLVPPEKRSTAEAVIAGMGLRPVLEGGAATELAPHATAYLGDEGSIDLHWTLRGLRAEPREVWDALSPGAGELELETGPVPVPREAV